jgi:hypothetical protein
MTRTLLLKNLSFKDTTGSELFEIVIDFQAYMNLETHKRFCLLLKGEFKKEIFQRKMIKNPSEFHVFLFMVDVLRDAIMQYETDMWSSGILNFLENCPYHIRPETRQAVQNITTALHKNISTFANFYNMFFRLLDFDEDERQSTVPGYGVFVRLIKENLAEYGLSPDLMKEIGITF